MANYKIVVSASAERSLQKLSKKDLTKVVQSIENLASDPYPSGCRKLSGEYSTYRIRSGYYRIIYEIENDILKIIILKVGHRKDIYRRL